MPLARQGAVMWPPHLTARKAGRWWSSWVPRRRRRRDVPGAMKERNEVGDRE